MLQYALLHLKYHATCALLLPRKTGPGSSGIRTSADLTKVPSANVISSPAFSFPRRGPGGTPFSTHRSRHNVPGRALSRQMYESATGSLGAPMSNLCLFGPVICKEEPN
jgi:hypothetical protein